MAPSVNRSAITLIGWPWWVQIGLVAILSALLIFTIRPLLLMTLHKSGDKTPSNVDALYGQGARVMRDFSEGSGIVKLDNGETPRAAASGHGSAPGRAARLAPVP